MKRLILAMAIVTSTGCSMLGIVNEDAGNSLLSSSVTVPANGEVVYSIRRTPNMTPQANQWNQNMGISRSALGWFGLKSGPKIENAGQIKQGQHYGEGS